MEYICLLIICTSQVVVTEYLLCDSNQIVSSHSVRMTPQSVEECGDTGGGRG